MQRLATWFGAPHSMTSSARASSFGGTASTSARAIGKLMTSVELGRSHNRQVSWLGPFENTDGIGTHLPSLKLVP
jgi:hypothetical protein